MVSGQQASPRKKGKLKQRDVFGACEALVAMGEDPTQQAVRSFLGRGSYSTLGPWIRQWREEHAGEHPDEQSGATGAALEMSAAAHAATGAAPGQALERRLAELEAGLQRLAEELSATTAALEDAQQRLAALEKRSQRPKKDKGRLQESGADLASAAEQAGEHGEQEQPQEAAARTPADTPACPAERPEEAEHVAVPEAEKAGEEGRGPAATPFDDLDLSDSELAIAMQAFRLARELADGLPEDKKRGKRIVRKILKALDLKDTDDHKNLVRVALARSIPLE